MQGPAWKAPALSGRVAVVTGASRGIGREIALALGECGATVYVSARSSRESPAADRLTGTVEETVDPVTARGGKGVAVRCDSTKLGEVEALFARVRQERTGLDILVNNAGAATRVTRTVHHLRTFGRLRLGGLYDVSKHATVRLIDGIARELQKHLVAAVAVAPGFSRTERVPSNWPGHRLAGCGSRSDAPVGSGVQRRRSGSRIRVYRCSGRQVPPFETPVSFEEMLEQML